MSINRINNYLSQNESKDVVSEVNINFLMAVRSRDYEECTKQLKAGANINAKFATNSQDSQDACSFCGPNDTPLTHAVKKEDARLVEFLLKNGANTEVFNLDQTPLMKAAFNLNVVIVKLLLNAGAAPNTKSASGLSAMHYVFLGLREWILNIQKPKCAEIVSLLMEAGFVGEFNFIADVLSVRGYKKSIINLIGEICGQLNVENFYSQGAAGSVLSKKIPFELGSCVGTFLARKEGGRLAQTCHDAVNSAKKERGDNSVIMWKKI